MEHKLLPFTVGALDGEGRTLEGYAAAFNNVDRVKDIIHPGAFAKTISERGNKTRLLWQHDSKEVIGKPVELREDDRGLFLRAIISDTAKGRDALALLKDGAVDSMSIGYEVVASDFEQKDGETIRNLREIKLHEVSLVTFPANEEAVVTAVKQDDAAEPEEKAGRVLSSKNRALLSKCRTELGEAIKALADLLDATDPEQQTREPEETSEEPEAPGKQAAPDTIETKAEDAEPDALPESAPLTEQAAAERDRLKAIIALEFEG